MNEIVTLLNNYLTESHYQDMRDGVAAMLPGEGFVLQGGWLDGREIGLEQDPEDESVYGIGQITVTGSEVLDPEVVDRIVGFGEGESCDVMRHPQGDWQGIAVMVDGARVWVEGLAADLFGGNVFDVAFEGHPASLNFVVKAARFLGDDAKNLVLGAIDNPDKRPALRELIEERSGISFADDQLYYGKGEDGLGYVYSAIELGMEPEQK